MEANKFATMLHRNKTPKIAIVLIFTILEWTLIALLLLNGLFSYLICVFADYFGLKPPCVFCSRVDRLLGHRKSYGDLICGAHAAEVSKLGYCSNHRNLAEASEMCEDCSSSRPADDGQVAVLSWMKRSEEGEKDLRCSCCDVVLESGFYSPYLVIQGVLDCAQKGKSDDEEEDCASDGNLFCIIDAEDEEGDVENCDDACVKVVGDVDESMELLVPVRVENGEERLVPVELIDSITLMEHNASLALASRGDDDDEEEEEEEDRDYVGYNLVEKDDDTAMDIGTILSEEEEKVALLSTLEINESQEEECSLANHQCDAPHAVLTLDLDLDSRVEVGNAKGYGKFQTAEEDAKVMNGENCEISIGSEICNHGQDELSCFNEPGIPQTTCASDQCSASYNVIVDKEQEFCIIESAVTEAELVEEAIPRNVNELSVRIELNEGEEERMPETPASIDSFHALHRRFLFERRESGIESLDGSVASEIDGNEILIVDHLKAALKAERKVLNALYAELEEERSASAIAASQTMAMITRLQEEKAAMQMEALQYQRMMEEQSEYDQEALQLLNELMMKREKEKQELEKELEVYRKKVLIYEANEMRKVAESSSINGNGTGNGNGNRSGTSSASSSSVDSDDLSLESHEGDYCSYSHNESNQNASTDDILSSGACHVAAKHLLTLNESLADFEEERLSILEQLKALEEKLFSVDVDELKSMGHQLLTNENSQANGDDVNGCSVDGFEHDLETNGKLHHKPRTTVTSGGKRLLPLFEAIVDIESQDGMSPDCETANGSPKSVSKPTIDDHKRLAIAEEVDNVYERLQALEADKEFIERCIRSLKKGDQGRDLLQEILQHLRDLRNVEFRVRNAGDALASLSS